MDKNNIKTNSENDDDSSECFRLDIRQFLHINVDKEKMKDELDGYKGRTNTNRRARTNLWQNT